MNIVRIDNPDHMIKYRYGYFEYDKFIRHNDDGPAEEWNSGNIYYFKYGSLHREDGPACVYIDGDEDWWYQGQLHRDNGPARTTVMYQEWFHHGELHRLDGPAKIITSGRKHWFFHGKEVKVFSQEDFEKAIKYLNF
jgi:hypothetical protein